MMEPTGKGAIEFLDFAASRGLINANTAGAMRAAVKEVLRGVEGEEWGTIDLATIDVDDYVTRFERLSPGRLKPDSLSVYKARFKNAVAMFSAYRANPSGWRYTPVRPSANRPKPSSNGKYGAGTSNGAARRNDANELPKTPGTISYPFPVRQGVVATLVLPDDLTKPEAKRLAAFVETIAIEPTQMPLLLAAPADAS
jgi:hypothetical protein